MMIPSAHTLAAVALIYAAVTLGAPHPAAKIKGLEIAVQQAQANYALQFGHDLSE
ncbi:hypothetical protein V2A60_000256 [Cordyceps javanica]